MEEGEVGEGRRMKMEKEQRDGIFREEGKQEKNHKKGNICHYRHIYYVSICCFPVHVSIHSYITRA